MYHTSKVTWFVTQVGLKAVFIYLVYEPLGTKVYLLNIELFKFLFEKNSFKLIFAQDY